MRGIYTVHGAVLCSISHQDKDALSTEIREGLRQQLDITVADCDEAPRTSENWIVAYPASKCVTQT